MTTSLPATQEISQFLKRDNVFVQTRSRMAAILRGLLTTKALFRRLAEGMHCEMR